MNDLLALLANLIFGSKGPMLDPVPPVTPTPTPNLMQQYAGKIQEGMTRWGRGTAPPLATISGELAQAGEGLPHPFLPAAIGLKETGGLRDSPKGRALNNPYGIGPGIAYPDIQTATVGGNGQRGLKGVLNGPLYEKYRQSGKLEDFINTYSNPAWGNPSMEDQIATLLNLLGYFK